MSIEIKRPDQEKSFNELFDEISTKRRKKETVDTELAEKYSKMIRQFIPDEITQPDFQEMGYVSYPWRDINTISLLFSGEENAVEEFAKSLMDDMNYLKSFFRMGKPENREEIKRGRELVLNFYKKWIKENKGKLEGILGKDKFHKLEKYIQKLAEVIESRGAIYSDKIVKEINLEESSSDGATPEDLKEMKPNDGSGRKKSVSVELTGSLNDALQAGNNDEAIEFATKLYEHYLGLDDSVYANYVLAETYSKIGDDELAKKHFQKAIDGAKDPSYFYVKLAREKLDALM